MRIIARSLDRTMPLSPALREHIQRRMRFALAPVYGRQPQVEVWVGDENGPRGGNDKYCSIRARIDGHTPVFVREQNADLYTAIAAATARIGRALMRAVRRREQGRMTRDPMPDSSTDI